MNSEIIRVSVIVPARNAEATIGETLESLQAQVFEDWEAVVVDDGSTDSTATLVDEMTRADSRIRLIRLASGGVSMARNAAIREARFDYLLFLDSDDWDPAGAPGPADRGDGVPPRPGCRLHRLGIYHRRRRMHGDRKIQRTGRSVLEAGDLLPFCHP